MRRPDTKERILQASIELFYRHGFAKASMREIAEQAEVTLSSSYNHFKDKYDILYTIVTGIGTALLEAFEEAGCNCRPGRDRLEAMIMAQLGLIRKRSKEIKIYLEEQYQLPPDLQSIVLKQHREIYNKYHDQIEKIEEEALLNPINKTVITFSILAMINWAYRWFREEGGLSMEEIAQEIIKFCFGGILKNHGKG
jgi:AcrR family transcriptional regulator